MSQKLVIKELPFYFSILLVYSGNFVDNNLLITAMYCILVSVTTRVKNKF